MSSRTENTTHISMGYRNAYYVYWCRKIITLSYLIEIQTGRYNEWKIMEFMKNRNAEGARSAMRVHIMHAIDQLEINKNQGNNKA